MPESSVTTSEVTSIAPDSAVTDSVVTDSVGPETTVPSSTSTTGAPAEPLVYVFPFRDRDVSYGEGHHTYPAVDVFGCGATIVAPVRGTVDETRSVDLWPGSDDNPAYRGGFYVSMIGDDGVRYYFAHLASVAVTSGQRILEGAALGVMGETGNAAASTCHTHMGVSWPCEGREWMVRRGKVWPQPFLDAWRLGEQVSPIEVVAMAHLAEPDACATALADPDAALA